MEEWRSEVEDFLAVLAERWRQLSGVEGLALRRGAPSLMHPEKLDFVGQMQQKCAKER